MSDTKIASEPVTDDAGSDQNKRQPMIEAENLSKFYGIFAATRDVSFKVYPGEVVAFLGPNLSLIHI